MKKRKRNPSIDWARQGHWFEAEGDTPRIFLRTYPANRYKRPVTYKVTQPLRTVSQDISRKEIVDTLCQELRQLGYNPEQKTVNRVAVCRLTRIADQQAYLENVLPHLISQYKKQATEEYLAQLKRPRR